MSWKVFGTSGRGVGLRHMAGGAEISARRDVGQHLAVAIHEMRDADHRSAGAFGVLPAVTIEAAIGPQRELVVVDRMRE